MSSAMSFFSNESRRPNSSASRRTLGSCRYAQRTLPASGFKCPSYSGYFSTALPWPAGRKYRAVFVFSRMLPRFSIAPI
eukprot:3109465-Pyramimonas_sp.AAC.1